MSSLATQQRCKSRRWDEDLARAQRASRAFAVPGYATARHNAINVMAAALLIGSFVAAIHAASWLPAVAYVAGGALVFGWLYFSLFVVVVHEASHDMFVLAATMPRTRLLNALAGNIVCIPFGINYEEEWRHGHIHHHNHPLERSDPQNCEAPVGRPLLLLLAKILLIPGYALVLTATRHSTAAAFRCPRGGARAVGRGPWWHALVQALFWAGVGLYSWRMTGSLWPLAAMTLGVQVSTALNVIKVALEHGGDGLAAASDRRLRTRSTHFFTRALWMPFNISLHFEHHLNMRVPWYRLGAFHSTLQDTLPLDLQRRVFTDGRGMWAQLADGQADSLGLLVRDRLCEHRTPPAGDNRCSDHDRIPSADSTQPTVVPRSLSAGGRAKRAVSSG